MEFSIRSESSAEQIYKEIINITDHAILYIDSIKYDKVNKTINFLIDRYKFKKRKRIFGIIDVSPKYDRTSKIRSSVIISKIIDCRIKNNYRCKVSEIIIGGGIAIQDNKIYICSEDDYYGEPFYLIEIDVGEIDIKITDIAGQQ